MQQEAPPRPSVSPVMGFPINADADQVVIQFGDFEDFGFLGDKDRERQGAGLFGRELKKWEPEEGVSLTDFEEGEHEVGAWDQFAENEKKFGVKTDFNMDLYTTRLEPEKSKYTVAQAEKLAREIQSASSPNLHLQDERNQLALDDSGISDEQLYSSVLTEAVKAAAVTPKKGGGRDQADDKPSPKSPERRRIAQRPLIIQPGTRPLIISNHRHDIARTEFNIVAREISSGKPIPHGSPLNTSPLLNDPERVKALDLTPSTERKTLKPEVRANFKKFKATATIERTGLIRRPETREETLADLRAFSEEYELKFKKATKSREGLHLPTSPAGRERSTVTQISSMDPSGFGSQLLPPELEVKPGQLEADDASPDVVTQRELPQLRIEREGMEDDDQGEDHSGRGLNPHATPFNPSHTFQNKSEASLPLSQTSSDESAVDPSPHGSIGSVELESTDPCEKAVSSEEIEDFPPLQPPTMGETLMPAMPHPAQPAVLIRPQPPQPPPPPPRVVTPPPPPPVPVHDHPPPPMVIPMVRPPPRTQPARTNQSPGGRRTPQHHMQQDPPSMVINSPSMIMTIPQSGPPPSSSGAPLPTNGPPPPVVPAMGPHMSGAMHLMPQHMAHFSYSDVGGRVPVYYSYPGPMTPVPGPPAPPGQQNNPNGEQGMPPPHMVYPYYHPAMSQHYMPYPPMVPQGMAPQFVPVPPTTPMTPQRPGSTGARPRARRNKGSFFNYGPRRG